MNNRGFVIILYDQVRGVVVLSSIMLSKISALLMGMNDLKYGSKLDIYFTSTHFTEKSPNTRLIIDLYKLLSHALLQHHPAEVL